MHVDELVQTALEMSDMDQIGDALSELQQFHPAEARSVCLKILRDKLGDVYYQASAFDTLYDLNYVEGVDYIKNNAFSEDWYVVESMLYQVGADATILDERPEVVVAYDVLKRALSLRPAHEIESLKDGITYFEDGLRLAGL